MAFCRSSLAISALEPPNNQPPFVIIRVILLSPLVVAIPTLPWACRSWDSVPWPYLRRTCTSARLLLRADLFAPRTLSSPLEQPSPLPIDLQPVLNHHTSLRFVALTQPAIIASPSLRFIHHRHPLPLWWSGFPKMRADPSKHSLRRTANVRWGTPIPRMDLDSPCVLVGWRVALFGTWAERKMSWC